MKQTILLWTIAFLVTAASAVYQRMTGPSYPLRGTATVNGKAIKYQLVRSHGGETDCPVEVRTDDPSIRGTLLWKRFKTNDEWTITDMVYHEGVLSAPLPHQPPAGKLEYRIMLLSDNQQISLPGEGSNIIRFKGDTPLWILIPHVLAMFTGMLLSTRTGLEIFRRERRLKRLIYWTLGVLGVGGFILGPIMQWYAFGAFWTGWPLGNDLTDNKTALAILSWVLAAIMLKRSRAPERWAAGAAIVTLVVYLIPHSMLGSELKYEETPKPGAALVLPPEVSSRR